MTSIRRALVSVSNKAGIVDFCRVLADKGVAILSTGGTAKALDAEGIPITKVSAYTGADEILDGRVKTLHPRIHGGILARDTDEHRRELELNEIEPIDLVVVNLYPFESTIERPDTTLAEAIEQIDIGGPCMLRAAAKNFERVTVVTDPADYDRVARAFSSSKEQRIDEGLRRQLATKAFAQAAAYDAAIVRYLSSFEKDCASVEAGVPDQLPETLGLVLERKSVLRYGENPHQTAALYCDGAGAEGQGVAGASVLQGKPLSYNNFLDIDAAYACVSEFDDPAVVIVKHLNPCGVASHEILSSAYRRARETDPTSSFGGIVAVNRAIDAGLAELLSETFLECVVAPDIESDARPLLARKKNLRVLKMPAEANLGGTTTLRTIAGGVLVQDVDAVSFDVREAKVVSERQPSAEEIRSLDFAWRVAKHVKSNAIVFAKGARTTAIGAGQMSRIDSVKLCQMKAQFSLDSSAVASDAFFPFRDGVDALVEAGATAVIQPGGSIRDQEVIDAANEHGIVMLFTGIRHFRH